MYKESMKINGKNVEFKVTDLGYNFGDPVRNGTVVEISNEERFCRLSDGVPGKVGLYAYHEKNKAFSAAAKAYLAALFPGMKVGYYFSDLPDENGKYPSHLVLYMAGIGPSEDGKSLYINNFAMDEYKFMLRWSRVWRYWTSHNICKEEEVKFFFDDIGGDGTPEIYKHEPTNKSMIRVRDASFNSSIEDQEYFEQLYALLDQLKEERK